jgi:acetyl esterase/lipase
MVLDHRLSPQHPFPAALIDALVAYLSLLYPTSACFHEASRPEDVVLVGDSAGANLSLSLLLLIQNIRSRYGGRVRFHDVEVEIPFPAGFASIGCQMDLTLSLYASPPGGYLALIPSSPFTEDNKKFDFLLPTPPCLSDKFPSCPLWPSQPPRGDIYCETSLLCHPLVSPVAAESFSSLPPMFFAYGEEYLGQEGRFVAQRAAEDGVMVEFHHYRRLFHVFPLMYPKLPQSKHCLEEMARFCSACVHTPHNLRVRSVTYPPEGNLIRPVEGSLSVEIEQKLVLKRMKEAQSRREVWTGPTQMFRL